MGVWYRGGTFNATNGSPNITGVLTVWAATVKSGDGFYYNGTIFEIDTVTDNTHIVLKTNFNADVTGGSYATIPMSPRWSSTGDLATDVHALLAAVGTVLFGTGAPASTLGGTSAVYYDTAGSAIYLKTGGVWGSPLSFTGYTWRGAYAGGTAYVVNDCVSYNGSSYVCISASTGNDPPNATYWSQMAAKGDTGATGATGPQGPAGGITGITATKGVLPAANGTTFVGLSAGANGTVLSADSTQTTGLAYVNVRKQITATLNVYVATTGNDTTGDGSVGNPFLTIQKAWDYISALDCSTYNANINVSDGTYTGNLVINKTPVGGQLITVKGNSATPANCILSTTTNCVQVTSLLPSTVRLDGFKLTNSAGSGLLMGAAGTFQLQNIEFGTVVSRHVLANSPGANVSFTGNASISGGGAGFIQCQNGANVSIVGRAITLSAAVSITTFVTANQCGVVLANTATFPGAGSVTGKRYSCDTSGVIYTNGGGANFLPGTTAGTTTAADQYV